jgi:hypothetical protein
MWATAYEYIAWPYSAITWFIWYPASAAYALAPAYQVAAECHARRSDPAFNDFDPYASVRVPF